MARATGQYFLYVAFQDVHWPLQVPRSFSAACEGETAGNAARRSVCGMVRILDEAVGNVTNALKARRAYDDAIVVFVSDNGGPTNGDENTASNNWPLRGGKNTLYEGGTRVVGLLKAPGVAKSSESRAKLHAVDWFPTLYRFAGGGPLVLNPPLAPGWNRNFEGGAPAPPRGKSASSRGASSSYPRPHPPPPRKPPASSPPLRDAPRSSPRPRVGTSPSQLPRPEKPS